MQIGVRKTNSMKPQRHSNSSLINEYPLTVVLSGFDSAQRGELKHFLQNIPNIKVEEDMTFRVKILISNTVLSNKYKAAATLGVPIVKKSWALDSFKQQTILPTDDYKLGYFTGVKLGFLGFEQTQYDEINTLVVDQDGECSNDQEDLQVHSQTPTVLVVNRGYFTQNERLINQLGHKTCDIEWLYQCKIRQCFVPCQHYLIQKIISGDNIDKDTLYEELLQPSLDKAFDDQGLDDFTYFQGVVAFINFKEDKIVQLIQRYISIGDGHFISEQLPMVTHIITLELRQEFQKTGAHIVNPLWVRDSLTYRTKISENDYKVYEKKQINRNLFHQDELPLQKEQNSQGQFGLSRGTPFQTNTSLMNKRIEPPRRSQTTNQFSTIPNKSNLFKGLIFYIYDDPQIDRKLKYLIRDNGGIAESIRKTIPQFENKKDNILVVLPDSKDSPMIAQQTGITRLISPRWVTYCIEKRIVEHSIMEKKLFTLLPTQFETPLKDIKGFQIYVSVKNLDDKVLFRDMVYILTGQQTKIFQPDNISFLISDKDKSKKLDLVSFNKIKNPKWLIQLFQSGIF